MPVDATMRGASLAILMDEITVCHERFADFSEAQGMVRPIVSRWRPDEVDVPAIYNVLNDSPFQDKDTHQVLDWINLGTRVVVAFGLHGSESGMLEKYFDCYRQIVDPEILRPNARPFSGAAIWANRLTTHSIIDTFGSTRYPGIQFNMRCRLDRFINPA